MAKRAKYLTFGQPKIEQDEIDEVVDTLRSGWLSTGPKAAEFERRFAEYCHVPHAIAVSSCTAALHLSLLTAGARPGTGVITTPFTFAATVNAIVHTGAKPLLVDIDRRSMNLSPQRMAEFLATHCEPMDAEGRVRHRASGVEVVGVLPVHFAGRPCDMDTISALAAEHRLFVIEDAAHAIEAWYHGQKVGALGEMACFSFYATKNLTTGDGGMITTRSDAEARRMRALAVQGLSRDAWGRSSSGSADHYRVIAPGYKYNLTDIAASIGLHQLKRIESGLRRREQIWARYDEALAGLPVITPAPAAPDTVHARHLYTILVDRDVAGIDRDELKRRLHERNIGTGIHFVSVHLHEFFREEFGFEPGDFPESGYVSHRTLSLPLSAHLSDEDVDDVMSALRECLA